MVNRIHPIEEILSHRYGGIFLLYILFLVISFLTRVILLTKSYDVVDWSLWGFAGVFLCGFVYDFITASYCSVPVLLYLMFLPDAIFKTRVHRGLTLTFYFAALYALLFDAVSEWFFWEEFGVRFNFIAVDYLVYTKEVIGTIKESYSLPTILVALFMATAFLSFVFYRVGWVNLWLTSCASRKNSMAYGAGLLLFPLLAGLGVDNNMVPAFGNNYNRELARNGIYSLFAAFRKNELDYDAFYVREDVTQDFQRLKGILKSDDATFLSEAPTDITRLVRHEGEPKHYNVIQITVESLSSEFLGAFGNPKKLTPNIDTLAREGLLFTNFHATGNRTDRGMEALTLSVPPTPGRSIVKRPHNEHLFSLGSVFKSKSYATTFIYSGYGYFDNMNYFFGNNGYKVVDRASVSKEDITFANIWGACDEDLYNWVLREADSSHAEKKPFFHFVMTTSNHRPFTYPEGKIDIPSQTGREGAVKYTDYAIGQFIARAKKKPWFDNTVFVIVADHCAGSAGKTELPIKEYEIPLIIYNPKLIAPRRIDTLSSQIDYPPTLLGLLNWTYKSRFYGKDILQMKVEEERALIANYQALGLMEKGELAILKPTRKKAIYHYDCRTRTSRPDAIDEGTIMEAVSYYQSASYLFSHHLNTEIYEARSDREPPGVL
jgi:phosphoglycerol transferase MdoB-like AlkP superfamily enzyme